jgi:hypothetical protein
VGGKRRNMAKDKSLPGVILEAEKNMCEAYTFLLEMWIPQQRSSDWDDEEIRNHLLRYKGLDPEAIDLLIAGKMPEVDILGRLEATTSKNDQKPTVA